MKIRVESVDLLRGLVIMLMALDHVRVVWTSYGYSPTDLEQTTVLFFMSRWITHFCAPTFVFLSGVSAWLHLRNKSLTKAQLSRFLLTRGIWLLIIEATIISFSWSYAFNWIVLQVLFALGMGMIVLAALIHLPMMVTGGFGIVLILSHNLLDPIQASAFEHFHWLWMMLHDGGPWQWFHEGTFKGVYFAYPIIPWIGVTAVGYAVTPTLLRALQHNPKALLLTGMLMVLVFLVFRGFNIYGDPTPWTEQSRGAVFTFLSFLNTDKYPPSLLFLLMTLGPVIMMMPTLERCASKITDVIKTFGRTPFLFYIVHLPFIHGLAEVKWFILRLDHPKFIYDVPATWPDGYSSPLWHSLLLWPVFLFVLYPMCRWFMNYRQNHKQWWLSYL